MPPVKARSAGLDHNLSSIFSTDIPTQSALLYPNQPLTFYTNPSALTALILTPSQLFNLGLTSR